MHPWRTEEQRLHLRRTLRLRQLQQQLLRSPLHAILLHRHRGTILLREETIENTVDLAEKVADTMGVDTMKEATLDTTGPRKREDDHQHHQHHEVVDTPLEEEKNTMVTEKDMPILVVDAVAEENRRILHMTTMWNTRVEDATQNIAMTKEGHDPHRHGRPDTTTVVETIAIHEKIPIIRVRKGKVLGPQLALQQRSNEPHGSLELPLLSMFHGPRIRRHAVQGGTRRESFVVDRARKC
jgi:hypothetical protein